MKKLVPLVITTVFLALAVGAVLALTPTAVAQQVEGNQVEVGFWSNWDHRVYGDSFTNAEVSSRRGWRISDIINTPDETGEPIRGLRAKLDSQQDFDRVEEIDLVRRGPPTYEWFYGDISEDFVEHRLHATDAWVAFSRPTPDKLAPGFDVSRTFDKTGFTGPDTQTMTVTITPREEGCRPVESGLACRYHLYSHQDRLCLSGSGPGCLFAAGNRLCYLH